MPRIEKDFGLKPGDEIIQCNKGFTWNSSISNMGPHVPDKVVVIKEYPRFILVEAFFTKNGGRSYKEAINKAAYHAGSCYFRELGDAYF